MIRIHRLQHWFSLPDPSIGGSLQDSVSMRQLAGIDLGSERVPDETTIICAPSPTKNKVKARDPQMQQTKKGNQWHFSMKAHIGTASQSKLMHPMAFTAAHAHDSQALPHLLHGAETRARGDSAYAGPADIIKAHAPAHAFDFTHHKATRNHPPWKSEKAKNTTKSRVRAKVEHAF